MTHLNYNAYFPGFMISQRSTNGTRPGWAALEKTTSVITMSEMRYVPKTDEIRDSCQTGERGVEKKLPHSKRRYNGHVFKFRKALTLSLASFLDDSHINQSWSTQKGKTTNRNCFSLVTQQNAFRFCGSWW